MLQLLQLYLPNNVPPPRVDTESGITVFKWEFDSQHKLHISCQEPPTFTCIMGNKLVCGALSDGATRERLLNIFAKFFNKFGGKENV